MVEQWGAPEDILVHYSGKDVLDPPQHFRLTKMLYQHAGNGVFVITLNNPKQLNCMSLTLAHELSLIIEHVRRDDRCKVVIWTNAGRAFSAGGNFTDPTSSVPDEILEGYIHAGVMMQQPDISLAAATRAMIKLPKISISAVNGLAVGGGVNLAFVWQDFSFVADNVTFRYPFAELGLTPELGSSAILPKILGLPRARELMQLGSEFTAQRALQMGLCTDVVPSDVVVAKALEAAQHLAAVPQLALRESKRMLNKELIDSIDAITRDEKDTLAKVFTNEETQKAMMAVMAKTSKSKSKL